MAVRTDIQVDKMPCDPGPAAWNAILPQQPAAMQLEGAMTADWLVIGAGFAGLGAARRLAQLRPHDKIVILEASRVAHGPAGRNSGFMIDVPHDLASKDYGGKIERDRTQTALNRYAIDFCEDASREYGLDSEAFVRSGKINAAATARGATHNVTFAAHLSELGESSELLDAVQMRELAGTSYYRSGLFTPGAALIQPALFVRGVAAGLVRNRPHVRLFEKSPVVSLCRQGASWQAKTPQGSVSAGKVILAVNGHAESFGFFRRRLVHVFLYASMTRALNTEEIASLGGASRWAFTPADPMGSTVRRISGRGGDRIVVRNRFTYDPSLAVDPRCIERFGRDHDRSFARRFPMLSGVTMEYRWGGRLCLSRNNVPAFGEVEAALFSACCQNGLGTAKGTLSGMLAAELATGMSSDKLTTMLAEPKPQRLPPEPFASIGAKATLRWGEWRAGDEL